MLTDLEQIAALVLEKSPHMKDTLFGHYYGPEFYGLPATGEKSQVLLVYTTSTEDLVAHPSDSPAEVSWHDVRVNDATVSVMAMSAREWHHRAAHGASPHLILPTTSSDWSLLDLGAPKGAYFTRKFLGGVRSRCISGLNLAEAKGSLPNLARQSWMAGASAVQVLLGGEPELEPTWRVFHRGILDRTGSNGIHVNQLRWMAESITGALDGDSAVEIADEPPSPAWMLPHYGIDS